MNDVLTKLRDVLDEKLTLDDVFFFCVGTDRSTGDSLGPMVGTMLMELGYVNVVGTLDDPVHALNLGDVIKTLPNDKTIIAIDACLGQAMSVGRVFVKDGPLHPGAGVDKSLPAVGDVHMYGVVNVGGFMEYFVLQNTRLSLVRRMASEIVHTITSRFPDVAFQEVAAG